MYIFEKIESNVRSYCHAFPDIFNKAKGATIYGSSGREYIDFLAGAGALNYGHNNEFIKRRLMDYLESDGMTHGLDMYTVAKQDFLTAFSEMILEPKGLDYKVQFCGPTGTNAVEASLKLARKVTKRTGIFSFMGGFHGMTLGSLAVTSNEHHRAGASLPLSHTTFIPYAQGFREDFNSIAYIENVLEDGHSGIEKPAAIIVETVQAEGGINVAPVTWLQRLRTLCDEHGILLICDDIQVGCGRTGPFFSFERAGIVPDMVVLSKSISGYGLPMSLLLIKPDLDIWSPAEHNGTFRGNQLAFVAATAALEYAKDRDLPSEVSQKASYLDGFLRSEIQSLSDKIDIRGLGMIWGIDVARLGGGDFAKSVAASGFELGLIIERVGREDKVLKIMPPLDIEQPLLERGCHVIKQAFQDCLALTH